MSMIENTGTREGVVAGSFYPAAPDALASAVTDALTRCETTGSAFPAPPRAVISPHAGYRYSGVLTASAISKLAGAKGESVAVLSPSHRYAFDGLALPSAAAYRMPGFDVPIDEAARRSLLAAGLAQVDDAAHDKEHGVETQLPFLNRILPDTRVIPLVIGNAATENVARVVDHLASRENAPRFILSSDLSHFLPIDRANELDAATAGLIETGAWGRLTSEHACGHRAIAGYLASDHARGTRSCRIAMANSHAVSGDANRTVGYGSWALFGPADEIMNATDRALLLNCARQSLRSAVSKRGRVPHVDLASFPARLRGRGASFVTLRMDGRLRGCIGSLAPHRPLIEDVVINTVKAGFQDKRFRPVCPEELKTMEIKIALLSQAAPMTFADQHDLEQQLRPKEDGLILTDGSRRGTFLPMVWEACPDPHDFVQALKIKAGLPREHWSDTVQVSRFRTECFAATGV